MNAKLHPVTFELPDELMAELTITAHAKGMTQEEWVTILVKQAMNELPAQADESQTLAEIAKTLTAQETKNNEGDTAFNLEAFEREFDAACLTPIEVLSPEEIRLLRLREHLSQPVFARYLNVSKNLISDWERGIKKPGGPALRLLTVIQKKGLLAIA